MQQPELLDFVSITVDGLHLTNVTRDRDLNALLDFSRDPQASSLLGKLVNDLATSQVPNTNVVIQGVTFGPSEEHHYALFDKLDISIPGFILSTVPSLLQGKKKNNTEIESLEAPSMFRFRFDGAPLTDIDLNPFGLKLTEVDLSTTDRSLELDASFIIDNPYPITLSVPFAGVSLGLEDSALTDARLSGLVIQPGMDQVMALKLNVRYNTFLNDYSCSCMMTMLFSKK